MEDICRELDKNSDFKPATSTKRKMCRGLGGRTAVQYYTHRTGVGTNPTWDHEQQFEQYGNWVLIFVQICLSKSLVGGDAEYMRYRVQLAKRAVVRKNVGKNTCDKGI